MCLLLIKSPGHHVDLLSEENKQVKAISTPHPLPSMQRVCSRANLQVGCELLLQEILCFKGEGQAQAC